MNDTKGNLINRLNDKKKQKTILFLISKGTESLCTYLDSDFAILCFSAPNYDDESQDVKMFDTLPVAKVKTEGEWQEVMKSMDEFRVQVI